jgi:hypothetical protein
MQKTPKLSYSFQNLFDPILNPNSHHSIQRTPNRGKTQLGGLKLGLLSRIPSQDARELPFQTNNQSQDK